MTPEKKKKIRNIIIIASVSFISLYVIGGMTASFIVNDWVYKSNTSEVSELEEYPYNLFKIRKDYPLLSERKEYTFKSGNNTLYGYYYDVSDDKGLVIAAHGLSNLSDGSIATMHNYFVELGYDVFAIDLTGSGKSEGDSTIGLHQSAYDIKAGYQYLEDNNLIKDNLILFGHSWGAYGSVVASNMGVPASKVIACSAYDRPIDLMFDMAVSQTGVLAYLTYPPFMLGNFLEYGQKAFKRASSLIKKSESRYLLIQGEKDELVPYKDTLYKRALGYDNVTSLYLEDVGHDYPWLDVSSLEYIKSKEKEHDDNPSGLLSVDLESSSQISPLVDTVIKEFLE